MVNAKKLGHVGSWCPDPDKCGKCGEEGHYKRTCPHPRKDRPFKFQLPCQKAYGSTNEQKLEEPAEKIQLSDAWKNLVVGDSVLGEVIAAAFKNESDDEEEDMGGIIIEPTAASEPATMTAPNHEDLYDEPSDVEQN